MFTKDDLIALGFTFVDLSEGCKGTLNNLVIWFLNDQGLFSEFNDLDYTDIEVFKTDHGL